MKAILTISAIFLAAITYAQDYRNFPMWNAKLSIEERVNDVVRRLTLEEKVKQMLNATPAVPRLGIPAYDWWNETLHGVARTPFAVTSYPQAIGMAATWDTNSLYRMADYSALEGRAINNKAIELGRTNERYVGLTYWTPNINIFRDPRWGRGQETYGEDPFLTAMLARAFVHGLQGDDPKYLKAAACAKHFAVHSGPEPSRHVDNFNPSVYDLWDTYLPAFRELVTKANVAGVMCAYNAVNTQPCCANDLLMNDILRRQWKFTGYVTSDCWAIDDFFRYHKTHKEPVAAAVDGVMHGTDIECGTSVYYTLLDAVKSGLIKEQQLDVSLRRLFTIRYRLGMFDPVEMVRYAQTPFSALEAPAHGAHALKMARQSIVLLKNENGTLPLKRSVKKIAVLGPNADNRIAVLGNYNGTPSKVVSLLDGIKEKLGGKVELVYEPAINFIDDTMMVYEDATDQYTWEGNKGFKAEYFDNRELRGTPVVVKNESGIDHSWQEGQNVVEGIRANNFSVRYTSNFTTTKDGYFTFEVEADDGYRLFINNNQVIDAWQRNRWGARTYKLETRKDAVYKLVLEYWQGEGKANVSLRGGSFKKTDFAAVANKVKDADAIIFAGGISPQLEGEEMPVNAPGFNGGDRTSVALPAVQTELMKALRSTGKPVVFVMMTGSAIAIPWEDENIPAIINAWYGGQNAGAAIADVLFGDYNPAGRLPVTFYKSDTDLPSFSSYDMTGRTYRYFKGEALYPFGYGLSYSRFAYSGLKTPSGITRNKSLTVTATVRNMGAMDGEEVVELYVSYPEVRERAPIRSLKGFKRIFLKAGGAQVVTFTLSPEQLSLTDEKTGAFHQPKGKMVLSVGGGQPGVKNKTTSNVISKDIYVR
ncbi:glycoside hydrolase family 3 C-terminal domain-containing protein [Flavitalea sp. BT771]|uniref:glycoside hydrolase family 3 C-terminal domain-containing protein n=1 Tax=Flavitalea sp. BT771 TaxID=3063329 RepID=UPI0026E467CE|nr:glycoside hydrolase family 3 C-terminal domain-containing protein [Flavitalea sp. BT771]MDO6430285.1 glycoside hydrolase family 3 C-terminal domain-containing protein [Flavitalea sp. BT771]MDV6219575.1 glycoside hydrolase family 3 C-terminal domain-containing protein [Flavitalea sp. BT771]